MKNLTLASVLAAVLAVSAAYAETGIKSNIQATGKVQTQADRVTAPAEADVDINARGNVEGDAIDDTQDTLTSADDKMREAADDFKAFLSGDNEKDPIRPVTIRRSTTADAMIGKDIVNAKGDKVATVKDIVVDKNGKPVSVIVSDGGMLGIGDKLAAFDYSRVSTVEKDGDIVMNLSQDMIDNAKDFSYDAKDAPKEKVMPAGSASVDEILDGHIVDASGEKLADIENVAFTNSNDAQLIVKFNDTFGMGGDLAAMNLRSLERVDNDGEVNFRLSENQSAKFKNFKKTVE